MWEKKKIGIKINSKDFLFKIFNIIKERREFIQPNPQSHPILTVSKVGIQFNPLND